MKIYKKTADLQNALLELKKEGKKDWVGFPPWEHYTPDISLL